MYYDLVFPSGTWKMPADHPVLDYRECRAMNYLDEFGRRHPSFMIALLVIMTAAVTIVLLSKNAAPVVLYEGF